MCMTMSFVCEHFTIYMVRCCVLMDSPSDIISKCQESPSRVGWIVALAYVGDNPSQYHAVRMETLILPIHTHCYRVSYDNSFYTVP